MKYTNIKKLLIKFMGGGLINFPTRFLRWVKIDGDAEGDDGGGGNSDSDLDTEYIQQVRQLMSNTGNGETYIIQKNQYDAMYLHTPTFLGDKENSIFGILVIDSLNQETIACINSQEEFEEIIKDNPYVSIYNYIRAKSSMENEDIIFPDNEYVLELFGTSESLAYVGVTKETAINVAKTLGYSDWKKDSTAFPSKFYVSKGTNSFVVNRQSTFILELSNDKPFLDQEIDDNYVLYEDWNQFDLNDIESLVGFNKSQFDIDFQSVADFISYNTNLLTGKLKLWIIGKYQLDETSYYNIIYDQFSHGYTLQYVNTNEI